MYGFCILNEELESMGGDYNAYTDYDSTVYTVSCLKEEFEKAIDLFNNRDRRFFIVDVF